MSKLAQTRLETIQTPLIDVLNVIDSVKPRKHERRPHLRMSITKPDLHVIDVHPFIRLIPAID